MGDQIARLNAGLGGGRVVDRRDDFDDVVFHRDLDAEAAEFALGLGLHVLEVFFVHIARMRIERGQHAVERGFDQLVVGDRVDVIGAHALEHIGKQGQLLKGIIGVFIGCRCSRCRRGGVGRLGHQGAPRQAAQQRKKRPADEAVFSFYPRLEAGG